MPCALGSHLALDPVKTKTMVISTSQMSRVHFLEQYQPSLRISDKPLERVNQIKLLGVYVQEHLHWEEHIKQLSKFCYSILRTLRKIKNFTYFKLRKHLVESLVLSKIDYCDTIFYPLLDFLLKRLQRLQFAAERYVTSHYVKPGSHMIARMAAIAKK